MLGGSGTALRSGSRRADQTTVLPLGVGRAELAQSRGKDTTPDPTVKLTGPPEAGLQPVPPGPHAPRVQAVLLAELLAEWQVGKYIRHIVTGECQADLSAGLRDPACWIRPVGRVPHSARSLGSPRPPPHFRQFQALPSIPGSLSTHPIPGSPGPPPAPLLYLVVPGLGVGAQATACGVCTGLVQPVDVITGLGARGVVHQSCGERGAKAKRLDTHPAPQGPAGVRGSGVCTVSSCHPCLDLPEPLGAVTPRLGQEGDGHFLPKNNGRGVLGPEVPLGSPMPHSPCPLLRPSAPTLCTRPRAEGQTHLPALGDPGSSGSH